LTFGGERNISYQPFSVVIYDGDPKAITSIETAVAAIEEQHKDGGDRVTITRRMADAVYASLESKHPRMFKKLGRFIILARSLSSRASMTLRCRRR
jgi:hypothetical protein